MNVAGYEIGPIACQAAFVADFDVAVDIPLPSLVSNIDTDRRRMDVRHGMRSKYVPLRFDPATGAHQIGGRYLFETWDDVLDYIRFTSDELEFEPGTKFWNRPFFSNIESAAGTSSALTTSRLCPRITRAASNVLDMSRKQP